MTVELDLDRAAGVMAALRRHHSSSGAVGAHLRELGHRMHVLVEVAPSVTLAERVAERLAIAALLLGHRVEMATRADREPATDELRSFAGGTALCSTIQVLSPIPARPSTSGTTGAIDGAGVARDAVSLAETARGGATIAGRAVPVAAIAAAFSDAVMCRLRVGSGAPISTRKIVDDDGKEVYEGSLSPHKHQTKNGEVLDSDLERRDRQMWRVEHSNQNGFLMKPYPGYPAFDVNAPRR